MLTFKTRLIYSEEVKAVRAAKENQRDGRKKSNALKHHDYPDFVDGEIDFDDAPQLDEWEFHCVRLVNARK